MNTGAVAPYSDNTQDTLRNLSGIFEGTLFNFANGNKLCLTLKISVISPPIIYMGKVCPFSDGRYNCDFLLRRRVWDESRVR